MLHERFRLLARSGGDRLPRQQTLRALIDWSYDLLDDDERAVFGRLSIFSGGWTLKAATAVCSGAGIDDWRVFELLAALVSKSLVVTDPGDEDRRFHVLDSIHEYGCEKLAASGEGETIAGKHLGYYLDLLRELAPLLDALEDVRWQRVLAPEIDNLRAAIDWAIFQRKDVTAGLQLLAQVEWAELLATPQEAIRWFDTAVALLDAPVDAVTRARVARHHVRLGWLVGRPVAQLEATAVAALTVARTAGDASEIAQALTNLAGVHRDAGRFDRAEALYAEAYEAADALSRIAHNAVLRNWAVSNLQRGDTEMARQRFSEVARRERPGSEAHASALINIGELEFAVGNVEAARTAARGARETLLHLRAAPLALVVCNLAAYAMAVDELDEARDLLREALDLLRESGARWMTTALEHHAMLAGLLGDHELAAHLVGFTSARYAGNDTRQTTERFGYERLMGLLTRAYDEAELARHMSAGASLSTEQALERAAAITQHHDRRHRPPSQRSTNHGQRDARTGSRKT
jgi:tetratricopeptide (TPR) repeat protein